MRRVGSATFVLPLAAVLAIASPALGDGPSTASKPRPSKEVRDEARARFDRGVELYNEQEYDRSLIEFERAYELAPNFGVLYNMAQVSVQLRRYAKAVVLFERFLAEGGTQIPEARVEEVERELAAARSRTAKLLVRTRPPGAQIALDDQPIGTSPMAAAELVDSGQHRLTVSKATFQPSSRIVVLAGGDETTVDVDLEPTAGPAPVVAEPPRRAAMWIAWGSTGVLLGATTVLGISALGAASDLDALKNSPGSSPTKRESTATRATTLATVTNVVGATAIVAAGVALYLTLRSGDRAPARAARIAPTFSIPGVEGTF